MIRLRKDANYEVLVNDKTGLSWIAPLNCTRSPTDNKLVRQALNHALDRQRMANTLWQGLAEPMALPWTPSSPAYDSSKNRSVTFELERARVLLGQAGITNNHLEIVWPTSQPDAGLLGQIYQAD